MVRIEEIEKQLPVKRKTLLIRLRENHWKVVNVDSDYSDWALDDKWLIESVRENKGFRLILWFFKYDGKHDGMDRVVATLVKSGQPDAYGGQPSIEFDGRKFERQLKIFMEALHSLRIMPSTEFEI